MKFKQLIGNGLALSLMMGLSLTAAGKEIVNVAESMERAAAEIEIKTGGEDLQLSGIVRLTTTEGLGICWLADRLQRFR